MEEFEDLGEILNFIEETAAEENELEEAEQSGSPLPVADQLLLLNAQSFLTIFKVYKSLPPEEQEDFDSAANAFGDPSNNDFIRHSALNHICEILFPPPKQGPEKLTLVTKGEKVYRTPCEDCQGTPTKLIEFNTPTRQELHYLCEKCEESARSGAKDEQ